jgi:hypothetical protein
MRPFSKVGEATGPACFTCAPTRAIPVSHWRQYFIDHPLLGFLGRKLIGVFSNDQEVGTHRHVVRRGGA